MIDRLINEGAVFQDVPISIGGQIAVSLHLLGDDNPVFADARNAVATYCLPDDRLSKTGLLELWKNKKVSFAAKCLATIWWGRPDHRIAPKVYSETNLDLLGSYVMEQAFISLSKEPDFRVFKERLETLFQRLGKNGDLHLNGIGVSFYTKFFHFFFASHPPKSNPHYLPVIADDIMRSAVFAEMIDKGEDVNGVFYPCDASLRSYVGYTDRFNTYSLDFPSVSPFILEDIIFNKSKGLGSVYVAAYNGKLCLPHWIAGRYNAEEQVAIVFNNLIGETYLFEGPTAVLWNELLKYDYGEGFRTDDLRALLECGNYDLLSFFKDLIDKRIIVNHKLRKEELCRIKKSVNKAKRAFLKSSKGIGNFISVFESVDNDYRSRIVNQGIPLSASIELTYACNEACIHCYNPNSPREGGDGTRKAKPVGEMRAEEYFPVLESLAKMGVAKIVFTGGDPFMKKGLMTILRRAHELKFAISVYTNGQALYSNPNLYDEIKELYPQYIGLSLYSTIPEVHDSITRRKGSCEKTKTVARWCYEDAIGLQVKCPIMQANMDSYGKVFDFAMSINGMPQFDVNITSSIDGDCFATQKLRLTEEQLKEVLKDPRIPLSIENSVGAIDRKPEMIFCGAGESSFNLQPDGTVSPCCAFPLDCGNVRDQEFEKIWKESVNLRRVRTLRYKDSDICGKERFCKYCNRCMGQSYVEHGMAENHCEDNCFLARIRHALAEKQENPHS